MDEGDGKPVRGGPKKQVNVGLIHEVFDFVELVGLSQDIPVSPAAVCAKWIEDRYRHEKHLLDEANDERERRRVGDRRIRNFPPQKKSDNQS